jgi:putative NADPH-quinone reductase
MRILHLYAHPLDETSFHGAIRRRAGATLEAAGHEVDLLDLYAEGFDPVLSADERRHYHDEGRNTETIAGYVDRLRRAEALVVQFPTWSFGPPAILKGFFDRVFVPGVAFDISDPANVRPLLGHVRRLVGVVTYGRPRLHARWVGDPPRKMVTRYLRWFVAADAQVRYEALYHLNVATDARRRRFLDRVARRLGAL